MKISETIKMIEQAGICKFDYIGIRKAFVADNASELEISEGISESIYQNYPLVKDCMERLGITSEDLKASALSLKIQFPESYDGDDAEFAVWDVADGYLMELLGRDKRFAKRAGWTV